MVSRNRRTSVRRLSALPVLVALVLALGALSGCGGDSDTTKKTTPAEVMAGAKKLFDESKGVFITLSTKSVPTSGNAVLGAEGTVVHPSSFQGTVKVIFSGLTATVPITAVDGKVYAKMPLQTKFDVIDPAEYGAPDPAMFADPDNGLSSLLVKLDGLKKGDQVREGKSVLTSYTGTLPGAVVKEIIPSASASKTYKTTVGVDQDGFAQTVRVTGTFFAADGDVTYNVTFSGYGKAKKITAP